jgi:hypothetical protein
MVPGNLIFITWFLQLFLVSFWRLFGTLVEKKSFRHHPRNKKLWGLLAKRSEQKNQGVPPY